MGLKVKYVELESITTAERDALTVDAGTIIYNSDDAKHQKYNGSSWDDVDGSGGTPEWFPPSIPMGSVLTSGASFFINPAGGIVLELDGSSDDRIFLNDSLNRGGAVNYDGSDLAIVLKCRLDQAPQVNDDVELKVIYNFFKDGDDTGTGATDTGFIDYVIDDKTVNEQFEIQLPTMTGVAGAEIIGWEIRRNGAGGGQDFFDGALEILGMYYKKITS